MNARGCAIALLYAGMIGGIILLLAMFIWERASYKAAEKEIGVLELRLLDAEFARDIAEEEAAELRERIGELEAIIDAQAEAIEPSSFESAVEQGLLEYAGEFRRTYYSLDGSGIGTIGASGQTLFPGAAAMNPADMRRIDANYGDEICVIRPDGTECWMILLDASEASGIVDSFVISDSDIPGYGTEQVSVWVKRV